MPRRIVFSMAALWLVAFTASIYALDLPPDFGGDYSRGLSRLQIFAAWQIGALLAAILAALAALRLPRPLPWPILAAGLGPLVLHLLFGVGVLIYLALIAAGTVPAPAT